MIEGTLFQLRNLLKRSVSAKIRSDPTACEEFFLVVVQAHIVCLVMKEFQLSSVNDTSSCKQFSKEQFLDQSSERRQQIFLEFISKLVSDYTHIPEMEKTYSIWGCYIWSLLIAFVKEME